MDKPLRILAIVNLPWDPRLGASRVFIELTEQWKAAGHHVEKFCLTDAFPSPTRSRGLSALRELRFPSRAVQYVQRNASRFDVIDALMGTLPVSKEKLGFKGLLVARSIGLYRAFDQFVRDSRKRWPDRPKGKFLGRYFYRVKRSRLARNSHESIRQCDLVNLPNKTERELLPEFGHKNQIIVEPYGLNAGDSLALAAASAPAETRLASKEVCFVGMWGLRKGAGDWSKILNHVRQQLPNTKFKFLGTMTDEQTVLNDLNASHPRGISVISTYDPKDLPTLIGNCAVGLFPSYIEGFGIAVIEQLAAGIPTVAYDVPGPGQILGQLHSTLLVAEGDTSAMAARAAKILQMDPEDYSALSTQCRSIAAQFRWEQIAADTLREYRLALDRLPRRQ